ncbi:response regulator transcription factor [Chryseobacterium sp. VD8]|uniref:response regulator transcription factor n=1 Tax=Chryseobacterium sp. VD8 TaxID=3081254 RepID=UPI003019A3FE
MKICIVDDHKVIAQSIKNSINESITSSEIDTYSCAADFFEKCDINNLPQILITDLLMPGINGVELLKSYKAFFERQNHINCKIIVLSIISDVHTIKMAMRYGADVYLSKESDLEELLFAIDECLKGNRYYGKNLRDSIIDSITKEEQIIFHLSPREKEVLKHVCSGKTIKEAAHSMNLSVHTVKTYYKNIMKKFNVNRTSDLIVFAIKNGLYHP